MLSVSRSRSSQQEPEQGATADALGQRELTRTSDCGSCVRLICGDAGARTGSCFLSPDDGSRIPGHMVTLFLDIIKIPTV